MTDPRQGDALLRTVARLPCGAGIVFRHRELAAGERRALFDRVRRMARARGLMLVLAGPERQARAWGADGAHGWDRGPRVAAAGFLRSRPCHDAAQVRAARTAGVALLFVSPVYPTRSHPGTAALGLAGLLRLTRGRRGDVVALGGMTPRRARGLARVGMARWAAIDGLTRG